MKKKFPPIGEYEVIKILGRGTYGQVFEVTKD